MAEWREVVGFPDYEVSDEGEVRRGLHVHRFPGRPIGWNLTHVYPSVQLRRGDRRINQRVHRIVMEAFVGPRPDDKQTRHLNGDPLDNRLVNLAYGTSAENMQDVVRHGHNHRANQTACLRGHEFTPENTRILPNGSRRCITCRREYGKKSYQRHRNEILERRASQKNGDLQ